MQFPSLSTSHPATFFSILFRQAFDSVATPSRRCCHRNPIAITTFSVFHRRCAFMCTLGISQTSSRASPCRELCHAVSCQEFLPQAVLASSPFNPLFDNAIWRWIYAINNLLLFVHANTQEPDPTRRCKTAWWEGRGDRVCFHAKCDEGLLHYLRAGAPPRRTAERSRRRGNSCRDRREQLFYC
jgi:hypothetical protein